LYFLGALPERWKAAPLGGQPDLGYENGVGEFAFFSDSDDEDDGEDDGEGNDEDEAAKVKGKL
jgi:hypothetical protein